MHGLEPVAAARARLALVPVDRQRHRHLVRNRERDHLLVVLQRSPERGDHRLAEPLGLLLVEVRAPLERRQPGRVQDLIDPGAPDPGDHPLVAQERVQRARRNEEREQRRGGPPPPPPPPPAHPPPGPPPRPPAPPPPPP